MYYSAIGILAIVLHIILNHEYYTNKMKFDEVDRAYKHYSFAALLYYITDSFWGIIHDLNIPLLLYIDTVLYYLAMALTVLMLCRYITTYLHLSSAFAKFIRKFGAIFAIAEVLLLIINHFKPIFFEIDSKGVYHAYVIRYLALYSHVLLCVLLAVQTFSLLLKAYGENRKRYITIFLFCSEMTIAIVAQILFPLLPLYSFGLLIGIAIINSIVNRSEKEEQYHILMSMANIYYSMHIINLEDDTVQEFNSQDDVRKVVNKNNGATEMMRNVMIELAIDDYREKALEFTDLTTVADRMKGKKSISAQLIGLNTGWFVAMFIAIENDNEGRPTKVIFTTRVIDEEKKQEEQLIIQSQVDELTCLFNRRAYEDDILQYPDIPVEPDFVYAAVDVNGLKVVNDELGHAAGDELLIGAADCLKRTLGNYGKVYRIGGDEFVAIFFADEKHLRSVSKELEETTLNWRGKFVDSLSMSIGYVTKQEYPDETVVNLAKIADERMYNEKTLYYAKKGIDRRGQAAAHTALCNLYTKILKINLTDDSYSIVNMDTSEQTLEKGFTTSISGWLSGFGKSGQVHSDDLDLYLEKTDINYLRKYFKEGKTSISIFYKRKYNDGFKQVAMEMIPADDYTHDNQSLFLYVKNIDI